MRIALRILLVLALPGLVGCAVAPRPATGPATPRTALDLLRRTEPEIVWKAAGQIHGDLDMDGADDFALTGIRGNRFVVGIVRGPVSNSSRSWILEFPWDGSQDALCSRRAKIGLEKIKKDDPPGRNGLGIELHDDDCDSFHIYWDPGKKAYDWWRL